MGRQPTSPGQLAIPRAVQGLEMLVQVAPEWEWAPGTAEGEAGGEAEQPAWEPRWGLPALLLPEPAGIQGPRCLGLLRGGCT